MKMKRYLAPDMRQALKLVRDEQGADAVILASRRVAGQVEITVALEHDDTPPLRPQAVGNAVSEGVVPAGFEALLAARERSVFPAATDSAALAVAQAVPAASVPPPAGAVNDEVTIALPAGLRVVAIVTRASSQAMGLRPGVAATALVKASSVMLVTAG